MEKITLLYITPLSVADMAIGCCWDKQKPTCDLKRMDRVANKFNHRSTIEHIYVTWIIRDSYFLNKFKCNKYAIVNEKDDETIVTINMRALGDIYLTKEEFKLLLPEEYLFLVLDEPIPEKKIPNIPYKPYIGDNGTMVAILDTNFRYVADIDKENIVVNFYIAGCSRGVLQELARHRSGNFSVKSSRYTLKELSNERPFKTLFWITKEQRMRAEEYLVLIKNKEVDDASISALERLRKLIKSGISNDIAKVAMPEAYRTELVLSFPYYGLINFLKLRLDKSAWIQIRSMALSVLEVLPMDLQLLVRKDIDKK